MAEEKGRSGAQQPFQPFPWPYVREIPASREIFFDTSIAFTKEELIDQASPCPSCGKDPDDLAWVPVDTAEETWPRGEGATGFVTCCMDCREQVDFFVDEDLTEIEREVRADGASSAGITWREADGAVRS